MLAHGGDPDALTVEDLRGIAIMLSDGLIGNKAVGGVLGSIASGIYSYFGTKSTVSDMIPSLWDYISPPKTPEEREREVARRLIAFARRGGPA